MTSFIFLLSFFFTFAAKAADFSGEAIAVDGDTLIIEGMHVDLWGIDAPELDQICQRKGADWPCGLAAKSHLSKFIEGRVVTCVEKQSASNTYSNSKCAVGSLDLGAEMVEVGLALPIGPIKDSYYIRSYKEARGLGRGIHAGRF